MNFCQKTIKIAQRLFGTEEYVSKRSASESAESQDASQNHKWI